MYNQERKEAFLAQKSHFKIAHNIVTCFSAAEEKEKEYGLDLCDWTSGLILDFYRYYSTTSIQTLIMLNTALREYANWCLINNLVADHQNHYAEITPEILYGCIDTYKLKQTIVTREDLLQRIQGLHNDLDKVIILGLFEGVTYDDLVDMKRYPEIKDGILKLPGREIHISEELEHYIYNASSEDCYMGYGVRNQISELAEGDKLIRQYLKKGKAIGGDDPEKVKERITRTTRICYKYMGLSAETKQSSLNESGRLEMVKKLMAESGLPMLQVLRVYRDEIETQHGRVQNEALWAAMYGNM